MRVNLIFVTFNSGNGKWPSAVIPLRYRVRFQPESCIREVGVVDTVLKGFVKPMWFQLTQPGESLYSSEDSGEYSEEQTVP